MNEPTSVPPARHVARAFVLTANGATVFGSDRDCDHPLPGHPRIAGRHLVIQTSPAGSRLRDLGAGTNVNGRWVVGRTVDLLEDDEIDIGPLAFRFSGLQLEPVATMGQVQLSARRVSHTVVERGRPKPLLQNVSLVLRPHEFACILGPSGCGKSTLMAALSGRLKPNHADSQVQLNHRDLYRQFERMKQNLVLVPQRTVVHSELTVEEALRFSARLRLPPSADREGRVTDLLGRMGLGPLRHKRIKHLSGGQEKRLCLANELVSDPGLIFLDEVTSGLDDLTDGYMMGRFRELADGGKTVACITHSLAHVGQCHLVVVLAPGGRLMFVGPPDRALSYFRIGGLSDVYDLFGETEEDREHNSRDYADKFLQSREHQEYVAARMPEAPAPPAGDTGAGLRAWPAEAAVTIRQGAICTRRGLTILFRDLPAIASLVGQTLLVAVILIWAFGPFGEFPKPQLDDQMEKILLSQKEVVHRSTVERIDYVRKLLNLTFLLCVTCFWFGCNNAAKEIVRERTITGQERMFNLCPFAYYSSKLFICTLLSWLQTAGLVLLVWSYCLPPGDVRTFFPVTLAVAFVGTTLGLAISATAPSESVAVALIPIAVIPQIVLSGAIVALAGTARLGAELFVTTYWGKRGLDALVKGEPGKFAREDAIKLIDSDSVGCRFSSWERTPSCFPCSPSRR